MKTIKLFRLKKQNGLAINAFDLSSYKGIKFPTKESMILEIAKKLKKPVSEIQKKKTLINAAYKQRFDSFIEKKIVDTLAYSISDMLFIGNKPESKFNPFRGWHENQRYNEKTKTFEIELSYKNRIEYEIGNSLKTIEINEDFLKGRRKLEDDTYEKFTKSKYFKWYGETSWNSRIKQTERLKKDMISSCPKFVRYWTTKEGKKEIELIEKTLEDLGKIKFEIYDVKGKKIETLYAKYKRTTEVYNFDETVKEIISTHTKNGITQETFRTKNSIGMSISIK